MILRTKVQIISTVDIKNVNDTILLIRSQVYIESLTCCNVANNSIKRRVNDDNGNNILHYIIMNKYHD